MCAVLYWLSLKYPASASICRFHRVDIFICCLNLIDDYLIQWERITIMIKLHLHIDESPPLFYLIENIIIQFLLTRALTTMWTWSIAEQRWIFILILSRSIVIWLQDNNWTLPVLTNVSSSVTSQWPSVLVLNLAANKQHKCWKPRNHATHQSSSVKCQILQQRYNQILWVFMFQIVCTKPV